MRKTNRVCRQLVLVTVAFAFAFSSQSVYGQSENSTKKTIEPVFRVPKISNQTKPGSETLEQATPNQIAPSRVQPNAVVDTRPVARVADAREIAPAVDKKTVDLVPRETLTEVKASHPLDRAVQMARTGLESMRDNIFDYQAILVRRERVGDVLGEPNYIKIKIRNPRIIDNRDVPFSIYMKFLKPRACAGREVVWIQGRNNNNLIAHETTALLKFKNFHLDPDGFLAMKGNKYPIYDAGLENLVLKLIEKAERDRAAGQCEVKYLEGAKINKRPCTVIKVIHKERKAPYEFHMAKVYIDDELNIPVRYVSYDWPTIAGGKPRIIEEYTYVNVELNVGLTDYDFNISNPAYGFAR